MRIAHFSDLHLRAPGSVGPGALASPKVAAGALNLLLNRGRKHRRECAEALVDDINVRGYDHAICSGDLVNLGLREEFALAAELCARLRLGPAGVTMVPGNHDYYTPEGFAERRFERAFGPYATGDGAAGPEYPFLRVRAGLAVVGLCSAYVTPFAYADGRLGAAQIARAQALLTSAAARECFRLVVVHHPPVAHHGLYLRQLRDRDALLTMLAEAGADLVVHGHDHRDEWAAVPARHGSIPIVGVGSGSTRDPRLARSARYHVYTIEGRRLVRIETRAWDEESGAFHTVM